MMYLLDTNACIRLLNRDRSSLVAQRLAMVKPSQVRLWALLMCEMF
jgi:predicted nucleic acid-binding protein